MDGAVLNRNGVVNLFEAVLDDLDFELAGLVFGKALRGEVDSVHLVGINQREVSDTQFGQHLGQVRADGADADDGQRLAVDGLLVNDRGVAEGKRSSNVSASSRLSVAPPFRESQHRVGVALAPVA